MTVQTRVFDVTPLCFKGGRMSKESHNMRPGRRRSGNDRLDSLYLFTG